MFGIPTIERQIFTRNFLRSISFSAKYIETSACSELADRLAQMMNDVMPNKQVSDGFRIKFGANGLKEDNLSHPKRLDLRSSDMQRHLTLTDESCDYEVSGTQYKSSDDLRKQYKKAIGYIETCGVKKVVNLSLRKQNILQFECESRDEMPVPVYGPLCDVVSDKLLIPYSTIDNISVHTKQSIQSLQLEEKGYLLTVKYGFQVIERDVTNCKAKGLIIVDLSISKFDVPIDTADDELQIFSSELYNAFIWVISEKTLKILKNEA